MPDVVVIGGGHNGLVAAAYLAAAGLKVTVIERRAEVGGAAATEEFHPGFRNSVAAYTVSLLNPAVIRELDLVGHGLEIIERPLANFLPLPDGRHLKAGPRRTRAEVAKFSAHDAKRLDAYEARLERLADVLRALALETPPNVATGRGLVTAMSELARAARVAMRLRSLSLEGQRDLFEIFTRSAGDVLDQWFESEPIKALLGFDGIVGTYASPYAAGTAYVLLHHGFGEVNGRKGVWGHAVGGMGAITQAMARTCAARGVEIRTRSAAKEILVEKGRATGVVTDQGERIEARAVVSNLHPKLTFERLVDPATLPADFRDRIAAWRSASGVFRMNLALGELPSFSCLPRAGWRARGSRRRRRATSTPRCAAPAGAPWWPTARPGASCGAITRTGISWSTGWTSGWTRRRRTRSEHIGPVRMRKAGLGDRRTRRDASGRPTRRRRAIPDQVLATLTRHNATFSERDLDRHLAKHIADDGERAATKAAVLGHAETLPLYDRTSGEAAGRYTTQDGARAGAGGARRRGRPWPGARHHAGAAGGGDRRGRGVAHACGRISVARSIMRSPPAG